jgi:hypothetical protein
MQENTEKPGRTQRIKIIAYWVFTGIVALETAAGAQWDLVRNDFVKETFTHLGYPFYLLTIIGVWKIPAFIAITIPKFPLVKEWAYAGLFFVYTGAAASHLAVGDEFGAWFGPILFSVFTVASWALRPASRKI